MVVIRRAPATPKTSSQGAVSLAPTTSSSKAKASNLPERPNSLNNGKTSGDSHGGSREDGSRDLEGPHLKKSKGGRRVKNGGKRRDKRANLADVLLRYLLLFFTIYSLSVCPQDVALKSPVCRGLSEYRRLILEPYISPVVHTALSHPSISPYVDRVKPYANQAIRIAAPVVLRTQQEWNHRIVPQWNKVVVPQYHKYIVPQYYKYLTPQLERVGDTVRPYLSAIEGRYESLLGPYVRFTISRGIRFQRAAQPYILIAADKTYSGYQSARPYMRPVWQHIKRTLTQLLVFLRSQRRQFVDPHVAKIWERIKELSREVSPGDSRSVEVTYRTPVETSAGSPGTQMTDSLVGYTSSSAEPPTDYSTPISISVSVATASVPGHSSDAGFAEDVASEVFSPVTTSHVESIPVVASSSSLEASTPLSATIPSTSPSASPPVTDDVDLDAFYADIGLDNEEPEPEVPESEPAPTEDPPLSEEQLEELRLKKLEETAEKRRDIMGRHSKWEEKLEKAIKEQKKSLRRILVAMRKAAVQEFRTNSDVKPAIDQLVENADKLLKGAEAYLTNLMKELRPLDEKVTLWTKVLAKVDAKFKSYLRHIEDVVDGWYTSHLEREKEQVKLAADTVRDIADSAQADVGYDYIWLADVTHFDWKRYHDLSGKSDNFTNLAISIQNGSHPSPPIDPVPGAVHEFQLEVEDVISGFETRFRHIQRNGLKALESSLEGVDGDEDAEKDTELPRSPEVSILPIPEDDPNSVSPISEIDFPAVGRGKVEVEEAFGRAESVLEGEHAEVAIEDEVDQSAPRLDTPTIVPPSVNPLHAEL
ncbi:hypothetical protein H4582DRAFT_1495394 [Lactarius indigo]|nr:hypothetical protein H4582DRAFT_1495394 [Lactarius indigo]